MEENGSIAESSDFLSDAERGGRPVDIPSSPPRLASHGATLEPPRPERESQPPGTSLKAWLVGFLLGLVTFGLAMATIDRPGMTVDEPPNVAYGKKLYWTLRTSPSSFTTPEGIASLWRTGHEHPPLTRFLLGVSHGMLDLDASNPNAIFPLLARPASAAALALLVVLGTRLAWEIAGAIAGIAGGLAIPLMPRVFGHGQLASPEVLASAFFLLALLTSGWAMGSHTELHPIRRWTRLFIAGLALGLALLAKLSNILLFPIVAITLLWHWRGQWQSWLWLFFWGLVGVATLIGGWPWLWPIDLAGYAPGWMGTAERLREFAAVGLDRATIYVWYFGKQYPNEHGGVPWHFVWVFFLVTVPIGLQGLGVFFGIPACWKRMRRSLDARMMLVTVGIVLAFFTLPIDRYDGERLFLMVFAPWGVIVGVGAAYLVDLASKILPRRLAILLLAILLAFQAPGVWKYSPAELSYYNLAVGGLRGANEIGLEPTYWGDSLTNELLDQFAKLAEPGDCAGLLPTLHPIHPQFLSTPKMREKRLRIIVGDKMKDEGCHWAILFHRPGYLHDPLPTLIQTKGVVKGEVARDGVWLTRLYQLPEGWNDRKLTHQMDKPLTAVGK